MTALVCTATGEHYSADRPRWCGETGALLDLEFTPRIDPQLFRSRGPSLWRYREAIPVESDAAVISFSEGFTPLLQVEIAGRTVGIKQDMLFPTGSYKDRGATVLISKVRELGVSSVVQDSSGNAGCAVAAYCARGGISCDIFVPEATSPGKLAQLAWYGATVHRVPGSREDTARAALKAARNSYYASHAWNPFFLHGTKTFAYEICEQMGWTAPDTLLLPAGNGTLLLGAAIGFSELRSAGVISRLPKLVAVQSARCAPVWRAFHGAPMGDGDLQNRETLAEGIAIAEPVRGPQMVAAIRESGGTVLAVEDDEIVRALRHLSAQGFYVEPTAAAAVAGLLRYLPGSPHDERVVTVLTGHGLKSTEKLLSLLSH